MKKLTLATTVSVMALAGTAMAGDMDGVSEIRVSTSYDAAQDSNAAAYFPEIATDVQVAIAKLIPSSDNAADPIIRVDLRKVALDGDTILPDTAEFNQLEGVVAIDTNTGEGGQSFKVNIVAATDMTAVPEGFVGIAPSPDDFYNAMVEGFALNVAERYSTLNDAGAKLSN
ncbi:hypothetical protein HKX62_04150 [Sulfitobacter sp. M74]|nr:MULTISPECIES: hypothetical protein [unclassified Sulfitobacter]MDF3413635.1 hypothetical protein [Sulfitobacter sp. KE5]MDF3457820.1 hypothetical protein [Sulfitobacter sp. S74]MDF3488865.1 hypothetical protein [Sulfitobacter sp. M60]MDF3492769.1 hypothetical protein [Sulfitobacter sp. M51]MDF3520069.1 hypothetical protein [Sulfitobacter sp. M74]MDF3531781.1 hypothetical protein [Sulfitobacter sp. S62]MDF3539593.1 hypothetical protein [Sulfitobacter sp. M62]